MIINVIGLGYIGLPTSLMLASKKNKIIGTDTNESLVNSLINGVVTFEEDGLRELYKSAVSNDIQFSTQYQKADLYIVTVPTPYIKSNRKLDTSYLEQAIQSINLVCDRDAIIVIESTVSPGTIDRVVRPLIKNSQHMFKLVHAPERILPGSMIEELVNNPRTIGSDDEETGLIVKKVYESFCNAKISMTDIKTAEMSKVVENTFRDINIAFANELQKICNEGNLDVHEVIKISNQHPRVNILSPGPGVGGHCISVDPWFLISDYPELTVLTKAARSVNDSMPLYVKNKIEEIQKQNSISSYEKIGIYGITYKENVDDTRESPTLQLYSQLPQEMKSMRFYDPYLENKEVIPNQFKNFEEFLNGLELIVVMVAHKHILNQDLGDNIFILDTKNYIEHDKKINL